MASGLTDKQSRFVEEYLVDLNASEAARRAGYSRKTAGQIGFENLKKPEIAAAIKVAMEARSERTGITADRVLEEIAKVAFSDIRAFVSWGEDGVRLHESSELSPEEAACVAEVSEQRGEKSSSTKFKLHKKTDALTLLARHLNLLSGDESPTVKIYLNGEAPSTVEEARDVLLEAAIN